MVVLGLFHQVRDMLQDTDANYWSDSELLDYYNSGIRSIAAERLEEPTTTTVTLIDDTYEYAIDGVLRYISATDSDDNTRQLYQDDGLNDDDLYGIIIKDYNLIYVNTPATDTTLTIKTISLPANDNLSSTVRDSDQVALKYYMLRKAYEKESDMENFQKSQYFLAQYTQELIKILKSSRLGYVNNTELTQSYFY